VTTEISEKSKGFVRAYAKRFGDKGFGIWGEHAWGSLFLLAKAMEKAGTTDDVPRLIQAMSRLTTDEIPEPLTPCKPGKVFDADRPAYPKIIVAQWRKGQLVLVHSDYGLG
jgi:ABC-type branched-subunit amino acid transport system substrate-binding protein